MDAQDDKGVQQPETLSSLVSHLAGTLPVERDLTVGEFLPFLGVHGFVFLILVLGLLNIVIFMLPGLSILFGVPMVIIAVQMLMGLSVPLIPNYVRNAKIRSSYLQRGLIVAAQGLTYIEKAIRPRLSFMMHPVLFKMHVLLAVLLAIMVAIPIPLMNIPPTVGVIFLSIGLMQRDGLFVSAAYAVALWSLWLYDSLGRATGIFMAG